MTDEPTPTPGDLPPSVGPPAGGDGEAPPVIEKVVFRPRSTVGWRVSFGLLALFIVMAVGGYVKGDGGEGAALELEQALKSEVNMRASDVPLPEAGSKIKESSEENLRQLSKDALAKAQKSEHAALVAVVAAREVGEPAPEKAIEKLSKSKVGALHKAAGVFGGGDVTPAQVESFANEKAEGFALRLAQVQAREMLHLPSGRAQLVDRAYFTKATVIGLVGLFALLAGLVGLAVFFSSRHKWPPVGFDGFDKSDGDRYMVRFAGYLVAFLALSLAAGSLGETRFAESPWFTTVVMALIGIVMLVWLGAPSLGQADRASEVVGVRRPFWRLVATGLYGYLCTLPLLLVALGLIVLLSKVFPAPSHPISGEFATASGLEWVALLATAVVLAPLTEEFAFRGLLLPALATQLRPLTAVLLCGFFFAAIHPQGPLVWPALMTTGAAAAYLRYQTGSLVPSMTLHALHNGAIFLFAYLVG